MTSTCAATADESSDAVTGPGTRVRHLAPVREGAPDRGPRAINPDGTLKSGKDWHAMGVVCHEGAYANNRQSLALAGRRRVCRFRPRGQVPTFEPGRHPIAAAAPDRRSVSP